MLDPGHVNWCSAELECGTIVQICSKMQPSIMITTIDEWTQHPDGLRVVSGDFSDT